MNTLGRLKSLAAATMVAGMGFVGAASATTVGFTEITNNTPLDASSQLGLEITDDGTGALFAFSGLSGTLTSFSISEIYFDDASTPLFTAPPVEVADSGAGVNFEEGGVNTPSNLSSGNTVGFVATTGLVAESVAPTMSNGIGIGEWYTVRLAYSAAGSFANLLAALLDGSFRIGLHVISINGGTSESYVNLPPVPVPAAGLMLLGGLGVLGVASRRRRVAA